MGELRLSLLKWILRKIFRKEQSIVKPTIKPHIRSPRIFLHPGYVISKTDGDRHYITARELARLYCVPYNLCTVIRSPSSHLGYTPIESDIHLYPDVNGDYPIFKKREQKWILKLLTFENGTINSDK